MDRVCDECRDYMAEGHGETEALGCLLFHRSRTPGSPCHCRCVSRVSRPEAVTLAASLGHIDCVNTLTQTGADVNEEEEPGTDVNLPGAPRSPSQTGADVNDPGARESLSRSGDVVNNAEKSVAAVSEESESRSCVTELRATETGAGVNEPEKLVTASQSQFRLNERGIPENCVSGIVKANEGWNRLTQLGANVNKLIDTVLKYSANRNTNQDITPAKGPVDMKEHLNMTEQIEIGNDLNSLLSDVRFKDDGASVNRNDNLVHTELRRHKQNGATVNTDNLVHTNVRRYKQDGAGVNRDDNLVHSALVSAVEHNQCDCTKMLVEAGADVNARKSLVLVEAARTGHDKCLEILLNKATMKVEIDACDGNKPSPLMWAAGKGHLTCAELLVKSGADVNQAFMEAKKNWDYDVAERLHGLGAGEKLSSAVGKKIFTYLWRKSCHRCLGRLLKKEKPDIHEAFRTLLTCSTEKRNLTSVEPLVEAGADVNTRLHKGYTALMLAAKQGNQKCVRYLIKKGANVNMVDHEHFETPLLKASFNIHYDCARLLLLAGARVNMGSSKNERQFRTTVNKTMVLLLHAAGEILIIDDSMVQKFAGDIYSEANKLRLKNQCRRTIRYQMQEVDLYGNLILRVQRLGLPKPLVSYMLFNLPVLDK